MALSADEVRRVAKLARLRLTDEEAALYERQFSRILELMSELSGLGKAEAPAGAGASGNVLREDEPRPFPGPERLLALAPQSEGGCYKVPKVFV